MHGEAKADGKRLLVNIDNGRPHHGIFHDMYACSGTMLLRSLNVLDRHTTALVDSTLSRHDIDTLAGREASVGIAEGAILAHGGRAADNLKRILRARRGALLCRRLGAGARKPFGWAALKDVESIAEVIVDTMMHGGSTALGRPAAGRIAPGAPADLLIYDSPPAADVGAAMPDSLLLLDLIAARRPLHVMIDGEWRVKNGL